MLPSPDQNPAEDKHTHNAEYILLHDRSTRLWFGYCLYSTRLGCGSKKKLGSAVATRLLASAHTWHMGCTCTWWRCVIHDHDHNTSIGFFYLVQTHTRQGPTWACDVWVDPTWVGVQKLSGKVVVYVPNMWPSGASSWFIASICYINPKSFMRQISKGC